MNCSFSCTRILSFMSSPFSGHVACPRTFISLSPSSKEFGDPPRFAYARTTVFFCLRQRHFLRHALLRAIRQTSSRIPRCRTSRGLRASLIPLIHPSNKRGSGLIPPYASRTISPSRPIRAPSVDARETLLLLR